MTPELRGLPLEAGPPSRHQSVPREWADRVTGREGMEWSKTIHFMNLDPEDLPSELVEVSEETKSFLKQACTKKERLAQRSRYPLPKVPATRTLQLDSFMKPEVSSATKNVDRELAKVQTLLLDALAPLTSLLEGDNKDETLDQGEVINVTKVAVELLGNASARYPCTEDKGHLGPQQGSPSPDRGGQQLH